MSMMELRDAIESVIPAWVGLAAIVASLAVLAYGLLTRGRRRMSALDAMARRLYGWTKGEAHAVQPCVRCRNVMDLRKVSREDSREYHLSGLCPGCWRELFPSEDAS